MIHGSTPFTEIPGFSPLRIYPDILHICDLQIPNAVASALFELVQRGDRKSMLHRYREDYEQWCEQNSVPFGARANKELFTTEIISPSTTAYVHISQKILKGAASRFIIFWLTPILFEKARAESASPADKPDFGDGQAVQTLERAYLQWRKSSNYLSNKSLEENKLLWPKHHAFEHLMLDWAPMAGNCLYFGLMLDEDLMGRLKKVLSHAHVRTMSTAGLQHYATAVSLHWAGTCCRKRGK
eukprot:s2538_g12.t1